MLSIRKGLLLGVLAYLVFLMALMPASFPVQYLKSDLPGNIRLSNPQGSVWHGAITATYQGEHFQFSWELNPSSLLLIQLSATFELQSEHLSLAGTLAGSPYGISVSGVSGYVGETYLVKLGQDFGASIENSLRIVDVGLAFDGDFFDDVSGAFRWEGGEVRYKAGRKDKLVQVPALKAELGLDGEQLLLTVLTQESDAVLATLNLSPKGTASVAVRRRMLDLIGQRWGQEVDADFVIFEIQEQLIN